MSTRFCTSWGFSTPTQVGSVGLSSGSALSFIFAIDVGDVRRCLADTGRLGSALSSGRLCSTGCVGEHCTHGETEIFELNTPKNSLFLFNRNALERNREETSHSYKDVHD